MKMLLLFVSILLFLAVAKLPIGYYTFLRIAVTLVAGIIVGNELQNGSTTSVIVFAIIAILFNPIFPLYIGTKSSWIPIDIICGIVFIIKFFNQEKVQQ
jgi:hypothetical protein